MPMRENNNWRALRDAIGRGDVPGYTPWLARGYNPDVTATSETIWPIGGPYNYPAAGGIQMEVVTASANDRVGSPNPGARSVEIWYLDQNYAVQIETVSLTGATVPTVATNIFRILLFRVLTNSAFNVFAAGTITLRGFGGGASYALIEAGGSCSCSAAYTVPAGQILVVCGLSAGAGNTAGSSIVDLMLYANYCCATGVLGDVFYPYLRQDITSNGGPINLNVAVPLVFPERTELRADAIANSSAGTTPVSVTLVGYTATKGM